MPFFRHGVEWFPQCARSSTSSRRLFGYSRANSQARLGRRAVPGTTLFSFNCKTGRLKLGICYYQKALAINPNFVANADGVERLEVERVLRGLFPPPAMARYSNVMSYLVFGILLRGEPKGADFVFEQRTAVGGR